MRIRLSMRTTLGLALAGGLAVGVAAPAYLLYDHAFQQTHEHAQASGATLQQVLRQFHTHAARMAQLAAEHDSLVAAIESSSRSRTQLSQAVQGLQRLTGANFVAVQQAGSPPAIAGANSLSLGPKSDNTFLWNEDQLVIVASRPVTFREQTLGTVHLGFAVTDEMLSAWAQALGHAVVLVRASDEIRFSSQSVAETKAALESANGGWSAPWRMASQSVPLRDGTDAEIGRLTVLAPLKDLNRTLLGALQGVGAVLVPLAVLGYASQRRSRRDVEGRLKTLKESLASQEKRAAEAAEAKTIADAVAAEGRKLASKVTVDDLEKQITDTVRKMSPLPCGVKVLYSHRCFAEAAWMPEDGSSLFFELDKNGTPHESGVAREDLRKSSTVLLEVREPRRADILAVVAITVRPVNKEQVSEKYAARLAALTQPLTTSIASALTTIRLERTLAALEIRSQEIQALYDHMDQAVLVIDPHLRVRPQHSGSLARLFRQDNLAGLPILDLLLDDADLGEEFRQQVEHALERAIGEHLLSFECIQHLLPRQIRKARIGRVLEISWTPVVDGKEHVRYLIVTLKDLSELQRLTAEVEHKALELTILEELISAPPKTLAQLWQNTWHTLTLCRAFLGSGEASGLDDVEREFRAIAATSRTLGLGRMASQILDIEAALTSPGESAHVVLHRLIALEELVSQYIEVAAVHLGRQADGTTLAGHAIRRMVGWLRERIGARPGEPIALDDPDFCQYFGTLVRAEFPVLSDLEVHLRAEGRDVARYLRRDEPFFVINFEDDWILSGEAADALHNTLAHLVRASVERGSRRELVPVTIMINARKNEDGSATVTYEDSGHGLDFAALEQLARTNGLLADRITDEGLAYLIFQPDLTQGSGKAAHPWANAGLDLLKAELQRLDCAISVELTSPRDANDRRNLRFVIHLAAQHLEEGFRLLGRVSGGEP